jgi:hypothetical protein
LADVFNPAPLLFAKRSVACCSCVCFHFSASTALFFGHDQWIAVPCAFVGMSLRQVAVVMLTFANGLTSLGLRYCLPSIWSQVVQHSTLPLQLRLPSLKDDGISSRLQQVRYRLAASKRQLSVSVGKHT